MRIRRRRLTASAVCDFYQDKVRADAEGVKLRMKKILYLQLDPHRLSDPEWKAYLSFLERMKALSYTIFSVDNRGEDPVLSPVFDGDGKKNYIRRLPESLPNQKSSELFIAAICDSQRMIDYFLAESIPVLGYEGSADWHLSCSHVFLSFENLKEADLREAYCRFYHQPMLILQTERTLVREITDPDLDALFELYSGSHMTDFMEPLYPRDEEARYLSNYIEKIYGFYGYGMWVIVEKETGKLIGRAGFETRESCKSGEAELAYAIAEDRWNQGYATEVCRAIAFYAFSTYHFHRLIARVHPKNGASLAVLSHLGFRDSGKKDGVESVFELMASDLRA